MSCFFLFTSVCCSRGGSCCGGLKGIVTGGSGGGRSLGVRGSGGRWCNRVSRLSGLIGGCTRRSARSKKITKKFWKNDFFCYLKVRKNC